MTTTIKTTVDLRGAYVRLERAEVDVRHALARLDMRTNECACCRATRWENPDHYRVGLKVQATANKLAGILSELRQVIRAEEGGNGR
jgi:hypothetical protein